MQGVRAIVIAVGAFASMSMQARAEHETVAGPWGELKDHVSPLVLKDEAARDTHYRRHLMRTLSGHLRAIEAVLRYDADYAGALKVHARGISDLSHLVPAPFAQPSPADAGRPGAKPALWANADKFQAHAAGFQKAAAALGDLPALEGANIEAWRASFTLVRHECLACHQQFRTFAPQR